MGRPCPEAGTWPPLKGKDSRASVPVSDTRKRRVSDGMTEWDSDLRSIKEGRAASREMDRRLGVPGQAAPHPTPGPGREDGDKAQTRAIPKHRLRGIKSVNINLFPQV